MRYSLWGVIQSGSGTFVGSALVAIYDIRTTQLATIYDAWSGGSAVTSSTLFTNSFGFFQGYVDDSDYPMPGSQWDMVITRSGFYTQSYTAIR